MGTDIYEGKYESAKDKLDNLRVLNKEGNFLKKLEDSGLEWYGEKELSKYSTNDLKESLYYAVQKNIDTGIQLEDLNQDEIILLALYVESNLGDTGINLEKILLGSIGANEKEILTVALEEVSAGYDLMLKTQGNISIEGITSENNPEYIKPLTTSEHLLSFITKLPEIYDGGDLVFSEDLIEILRDKIHIDAFEDYYMNHIEQKVNGTEKTQLSSEDITVIGLYSILELDLQSFPFDRAEEFVNDDRGYYVKKFTSRMDDRAWSKGELEGRELFDTDGEKINIEEIIGKGFGDFTKSDLAILLNTGNIGKYFLHDSITGELNFGEIDKGLDGNEFKINFHGNSVLNNTLGLGMLLANKGGPYITKIHIKGQDAILKTPPEVNEIGYHYLDTTHNDTDGDSYVEVYDYAEFTILEVSDKIIRDEEDITAHYNENIDEFIDINRGEEVNNLIDERLLLGGLNLSKISVKDLESLKAQGFDISKLFLMNDDGENLAGGLDDLKEGTQVEVYLPTTKLDRYLSAGLLFAPSIFGDVSNSKGTEIITEISVNGHSGTLQKNSKGKIGFYGTSPDGETNSFSEKGMYYREIHSGDTIKILTKESLSDFNEDKKNIINKDYYNIDPDFSDIRESIQGEAIIIHPLTTSAIDKRLLLEGLDNKLETLGGAYRDIIIGSKNEQTGHTEFSVSANAESLGLKYNSLNGSVQISKKLRAEILKNDFQEISTGINNDFDHQTHEGPLSPPDHKRSAITGSPYCCRSHNNYRMGLGLGFLSGSAGQMAMNFGGYTGVGKVKKFPEQSNSTIKAIVDGEEAADSYIATNKTKGKFDFFDIFSEGKSKAGKEQNKVGNIGVGHVAGGVIIQGKAYVADAYSELAHSGEETTRTVTEAHPGNKNNRKYDKKIIITEYEKTKLIPWNEYIKTRKIKRVVFHDAPGIDNKITSNDYKGHKEEKIEGREELTKLKNTLLRSGAISKGNFSNGMGVPYDNFEKDGEKILASIYEHARSPFEPALILAQMMRESGFSENALSHRGAQGYMQFMPGTAKWREVDAGDLDSSVKGAVDYLEHIHVRSFQGAGNLRKTLWGYNAGGGNIKHIIDSPSGKWKEPKKYANNILRNYQIFKKLGV